MSLPRLNDGEIENILEGKSENDKLKELKEQKWVNYFQVMASKDNEFNPKYIREMFDCPIEISYKKK